MGWSFPLGNLETEAGDWMIRGIFCLVLGKDEMVLMEGQIYGGRDASFGAH